MRRTIGTILGDGDGDPIIRLIHDDETGEFVGRMPDGTEEGLSDWSESTDVRDAVEAASTWYGTRAYHDCWVLCLRPEEPLANCTSEAGMRDA